MSEDEMEQKRQMLLSFRTCDPALLLERFGFPDQFRRVPAYDYARAPFDPSRTWLRRVTRLLHARTAARAAFYPPSLTAREYNDLLLALRPLFEP
jgi:hypothetical protein